MSAITEIGRFKIIREISRGGQGTVYLAADTQLERQVAIKLLHTASPQQKDNLLREARITGKFQHPNIVTLYDAGEYEGIPYLVYAFIEGETLAQLLKHSGALSLSNAARLIAGVLDGLSYAHQQGVMHLDIKPANVIVSKKGQPMLLDFGISRHIGYPQPTPGIDGTPQYMAPENLNSQGVDFRSDIYSVGILLFECVTGKPAVVGESLFQILNRVANENVRAPSELNAGIDEKLEAIIRKAVSKNPDERYPDAATMRQALLNYLDPTRDATAPLAADSHSTLGFLLRRMRSKGDFPALSGTISEINKIVSSDSESPRKLAQVILQDFALTNKILKLVNTVTFGQFGGNINTISKAVVIIGFDTVRNIAMTLILLEFLQNKTQALDLKDEVISSFFAGLLAAELSDGDRAGEAEEAMICAMFHNLGRLLAIFYFFEESREVVRLMAEQKISEEDASIKILGMSYDELGAGVAENWNFPHRLISGMRKISGENIRKPRNELDQLNVTVNLANELCAISALTAAEEKNAELKKLCSRFENATPVSESLLARAFESSLSELSKHSGVLGIAVGKSPLLKRIRNWSGHSEPETIESNPMDNVTLLGSGTSRPATNTSERPDPDSMLSSGIQDISNTLVEDYKLNDVLYMILETIYRSLGFKRSLIFIRDNKQNMMVARFGFGEGVDSILPKLKFSLTFEPDVFHLAIEKGLDIVIENVQASKIADKIPKWYRDSIDSQFFLLLPIMVNKKAIGLLYADMQDADSLKLSDHQLSSMRTLRNQAILAIKTKLL